MSRPDDLPPGAFLAGGEAWQLTRAGEQDAINFGVAGTENWGAAEIRGNTLRDLAALNKIEVLPWDEWGQMEDSYKGNTGEDFDRLIDKLAAVCGGDDIAALKKLFERVAVPEAMIG